MSLSDNDFFSRFRANTLKSMLKWMENPRQKAAIASTLQKNIPMDKGNETASKGRKLTNAVKLQLIEIEKLSEIQRQLMRQLVDNPENLDNQMFIRKVCDAKKRTKQHHAILNTVTNPHPSIGSTSTILEQSYVDTEEKLNKLSQLKDANAKKLTMLNKLSDTMDIPVENKEKLEKALVQNKEEEAGWKFRMRVLGNVVCFIKKKEAKALQHKKTVSLNGMMEKATVKQNRTLCKMKLALETINMAYDGIKKELMVLCTDINTADMHKMDTLQSQMKAKENEKEMMSKQINEQNIQIQGLRLVFNEVVHSQPIDINLWCNIVNIQPNHMKSTTPIMATNKTSAKTANGTRLIHNKRKYKHPKPIRNSFASSILNLPVIDSKNIPPNHVFLKQEPTKNGNTKRKFKRPTRSKVTNAKRLSIADALPQKICPIRLSDNFRENGLIRNVSTKSDSMFSTDINVIKERNEWIDGYNTRHIPAIQQKYRLIYGQKLHFKSMTKHKMDLQNTWTNAVNTPMNGDAQPPNIQMDHEEDDDEDDDLSDEFINVSADDSASPSHRLTLPNIDCKKTSKRNGRSTHRRITDRSHPLFVNDPVNRIGNMNIENETFEDGLCLHYVARGMCKFMDKTCPYEHPAQYDAKRFFCIQKGQKGECTRNDCKYSHDESKLPCGTDCHHAGCLRNHAAGDQEYKEWCDAYRKRQEAYRKWQPINAKRYEKRQVTYANGYTMNQSVVNDDRLHDVAMADQPMFDSALTE
eukprot:43386_1